MKKFIPTYYARSVYEIEPSFFISEGVKTLLIDLDNTLASYDELLPSAETIEYINKLKAANLAVYIVSNNRDKRVREYAEALGVPYLAGVRKPFAGKLRRYLQKEGVALRDVMMIGDQLLTDVFCANNLGVKIILTEQIVERDQWTTRFNRLLDRPIRKKLQKNGKLKEWNKHGR